MWYPGRHFYSFMPSQHLSPSSDLERRRARQNEEELTRICMQIANLSRARRHSLMDHTQLWGFD
jgi:hypothetical protein